jgi:protein-S-isoprenylcysteine O-methyltransferase Ste14
LIPIALYDVIGGLFMGIGRALSSAAALQQPHASAIDSVRVKSPLPGGVADVVRFLLSSVPPWIQIGGVVLAVVIGVAILWWMFTRRRAIGDWLTARSTAVKVALAVAAIVTVAVDSVAGATTWNYTQHSNEFCV